MRSSVAALGVALAICWTGAAGTPHDHRLEAAARASSTTGIIEKGEQESIRRGGSRTDEVIACYRGCVGNKEAGMAELARRCLSSCAERNIVARFAGQLLEKVPFRPIQPIAMHF